MASNDPDDIQCRTAKGKRGMSIHIDAPRDDSSLELSNVGGKDLNDRGLSHSVSTSIASSSVGK